MVSPKKKEILRRYLRDILEKSFPIYRSKQEFEKALEKHNLLDSTEKKQDQRKQKYLESIRKDLQSGGSR